jgi:hypothetical protein
LKKHKKRDEGYGHVGQYGPSSIGMVRIQSYNKKEKYETNMCLKHHIQSKE